MITGQIPDEEAKRAGLVDCHAYALLDLRKLDVWFYLDWKYLVTMRISIKYDRIEGKASADGEESVDTS